MIVHIYLDASCKNCEDYLERVAFWSSIYEFETVKIFNLDDDPIWMLTEINKIREQGHQVEYFPVLAVIDKNGKVLETLTGFSDDNEIKQLLLKYGI